MDANNKEWWTSHPHILQFDCGYVVDFEGGEYIYYFKPSNIVLNYDWITANYIEWAEFCDSMNVSAYPDNEQLENNWRNYFKSFYVRPFSVRKYSMYDTRNEMIGAAVRPKDDK
jgi:hypothetical protein